MISGTLGTEGQETIQGFSGARELARLFLDGWEVKILVHVFGQGESKTIENWTCYKELG
jgi:hypothetical protein